MKIFLFFFFFFLMVLCALYLRVKSKYAISQMCIKDIYIYIYFFFLSHGIKRLRCGTIRTHKKRIFAVLIQCYKIQDPRGKVKQELIQSGLKFRHCGYNPSPWHMQCFIVRLPDTVCWDGNVTEYQNGEKQFCSSFLLSTNIHLTVYKHSPC